MKSRIKLGSRVILGVALVGALAAGVGAAPPSTSVAAVAAPCDQGAVTNVANYEGDVIYQILTDRFADGDPSNNNPYNKPNSYDPNRTDVNRYFGGDWVGIEQQVPYLAGMGVGAIWISPPYNNLDDAYPENGNYYNGYHGFWGKDYFVPDEHWGGWPEFDSMVDAAHANGIKVVIDFAPNHTNHTDSVESAGFYRDGTLVGRYNNDTDGLFHHLGPRGDAQTSPYDYQYRDLTKLADLATENPQVQDYMLDAVDVWLSHGVDGIRNDATLHQTNAFRTVFSDHVNSQDGAFHFGEYFIGSPDPKYDDYRTSPERTGINILDFEFANTARDVFGSFDKSMYDLADLIEYTQDDYRYENDAVTWLDSHDKSRLASIQQNQGIFHTALAFLLTSRGTPVIYYGTEQYITGENGDAGRKWMPSFSTTTPAYQLIGKLSALRDVNAAIRYGASTVRWVNNDVLIVERKFFNSVVVVALNRGGDTHSISGLNTALPAGSYPDYLGGVHSGNSITVASGGEVSPFDLGPSEIGVWNFEGTQSAPAIGSVGPTQGATGYDVTIDGAGFGSTAGEVSLGGVPATIRCWGDDQIRFVVPSVSAGEHPVVVSNSVGTSNTFAYKVLSGSQVQVVMHAESSTVPGQQLYLVGSIPELGSWDPAHAVGPMFSPAYPDWFLPINLPAGQTVEFKLIKKDGASVVWEGGANRAVTAPASGVIDSPEYVWQP